MCKEGGCRKEEEWGQGKVFVVFRRRSTLLFTLGLKKGRKEQLPRTTQHGKKKTKRGGPQKLNQGCYIIGFIATMRNCDGGSYAQKHRSTENRLHQARRRQYKGLQTTSGPADYGVIAQTRRVLQFLRQSWKMQRWQVRKERKRTSCYLSFPFSCLVPSSTE